MITFEAMGTEVSVTTPFRSDAEEEATALRVAAVFRQAEDRYSRFLPGSEISRLNGSLGPTAVSAELFDLLQRARTHAERSGRLFDPAVGGILCALGYDRSFAPGILDRGSSGRRPHVGSFADVRLDEASRSVDRPAGLRIDLGGLVKGWTVDRAAECLPRDGAIDAGGDGAFRGRGPEGERWIVDVEDPRDAGRTLLSLALRDAAVATSGTSRRRWRVGDRSVHHLIDPRTGDSSRSDLSQVTVVAPTAELADVLAKTVLLLGSHGGSRFVEREPAAGAVLVGVDGGVRLEGEIPVVDA